MSSSAFSARIKRELEMLEHEPPPGVSVWPEKDRVDLLRACITGTADTPYQDGYFHLEVVVPNRYPFEPPRVKFLTPVYHPNIDSSGRICLNILSMPPKGGWKPALNISTVLSSIQLLLAEPNPDDALMVEISEQFVRNRQLFDKVAAEKTQAHALQEVFQPNDSSIAPDDSGDRNERVKAREEQDSDVEHELPRKRARR